MPRLIELRAENFKRLSAVRIPFPDRGVFEVAGKNAQGKSSAIEAIWAALVGRGNLPERPIRAGADRGFAECDIGDYRVRREWTHYGTRLTVTDARTGQEKVRSPQALLDGFLSKNAVDPMRFCREKPAEQAAMLRRVSGIDFADLDARRKAAYEERTEVNRAVTALEGQLAGMPELEPAAAVDTDALRAELRRITRHNAEAGAARETAVKLVARSNALTIETLPEFAAARKALETARADVDRANAEIARLRRELEEAAAVLAGQEDRLANAAADEAVARRAAEEKIRVAREKAAAAAAAVPEMLDPEPVLEKIGDANDINNRARAFEERAAVAENLEGNRGHSQRLTETIEDIDGERQRILAKAAWPVPGLSIDANADEGECVTYNGIPFGQASTAEQIKISLAMAAAMEPGLRLIAIKEGALLDDDNLRLVDEWAAANDYLVLVERVAQSNRGVGVVLEDGQVAAGAGTDHTPDEFPLETLDNNGARAGGAA